MSIKAGQLFWEGPKVNAAVSADLSDEGRIPHHPALPAVARWLVEHGQALITTDYPDRWVDWLEEDAQGIADGDEQVFRLRLAYEVVPALRALVGALQEEAS